MITRFSIKYLIAFSFCVLLLSCIPDAERDNPLDIHGSGPHLQLDGVIYTFYPPHQVIKNASLYLQPCNLITVSDQNGVYQFNNITPGNYTIICDADSFASNTVQIEIKSDIKQDIFLNGLPQITKTKLTTHHVSRWFPVEDVYYMEIGATVYDFDGLGDINSVYYKIPSIGFADTLKSGIVPGLYSTLVYEEDFPVNTLSSLIGKEFIFYAEDEPGTLVTSEKHFITRIIEEIPTLTSPVQMEEVSGSPITFYWGNIFLPFEFTFKIELFRIDINMFTKIDEIVDIPSNSNSFSYNSGLTAADYYWILFIVDEFGNSSRSKEGAFVVK